MHGGRRTEAEKRALRRRSGPAGSLLSGPLGICPFGWHFSKAKGRSSSGFEGWQLHAGIWLGCPITPPPCPSIPPSPLPLPPRQFLAGLGNKSGALPLLAMTMPRAESICFPGNSYFEEVRLELYWRYSRLGGEKVSAFERRHLRRRRERSRGKNEGPRHKRGAAQGLIRGL